MFAEGWVPIRLRRKVRPGVAAAGRIHAPAAGRMKWFFGEGRRWLTATSSPVAVSGCRGFDCPSYPQRPLVKLQCEMHSATVNYGLDALSTSRNTATAVDSSRRVTLHGEGADRVLSFASALSVLDHTRSPSGNSSEELSTDTLRSIPRRTRRRQGLPSDPAELESTCCHGRKPRGRKRPGGAGARSRTPVRTSPGVLRWRTAVSTIDLWA